jgi:hypothetical protein
LTCGSRPASMTSAYMDTPVNLQMRSASGTNLPILGAALLRIQIPSIGVETRQMVYFSPITTKLYLSLATCKDLRLVPQDLPLSTPYVKAARAGPVMPDPLTRTPTPHHEDPRAPNRTLPPKSAHLHHPQEMARPGHRHWALTQALLTRRPVFQLHLLR